MHVGGNVDEDSVGESELEIESLRSGIGGSWERFDARSISDADETEGGSVASRYANDGIGEESACEAPDCALVLDCGILHRESDLTEIRRRSGLVDLDERKALHEESPERSLHRDSARVDRERNRFGKDDGGGAYVRANAARGVEAPRQGPRRRSEHGRSESSSRKVRGKEENANSPLASARDDE